MGIDQRSRKKDRLVRYTLSPVKESRAFSEEELDIDLILEKEPRVHMLRPYRVQIGVLAGDRATYNLVDFVEETDNETPEE